VLVAKYGAYIVHKVNWSGENRPYFSSAWWKDISELENCIHSLNWWCDSISRKVGNGENTNFWCDKWIGDLPLCEIFPRLFSLSSQKGAYISEVGEMEGSIWVWNLTWRRRLFQWEEGVLVQLLALVEGWCPSGTPNKWWWKLTLDGVFSVKSSVESISSHLVEVESLPPFEESIFAKIWESPAPSKVIVFSWQLLYDCLPTKSNLLIRGVLQSDDGGMCVWCENCCESSKHLFLHCKVAMVVWYEIFRWLGVIVVMPPSIFHLFDCLNVAAKNIKLRRGFRLVWHTVIWSIWNARNSLIFNNVKKDPLEIAEEIKVLSWKWSSERLKTPPYLYYEWVWDLGDCFVR
jgi:hypothetical protein